MPSPPTGRALAQFWTEPGREHRDVLNGPGGRQLHPGRNPIFEFEAKDETGFSVSYDVLDRRRRPWSVKVGVEAQAEVASSRILWALGYRQPPIYLLPSWRLKQDDVVSAQVAGRFRPKKPVLESQGPWSWYENPFVGTAAYRGLLVFMLLLNSTDLKEDNNEIYSQTILPRSPRRWYVVKDLGATLGTTGRFYPKRNDIDEFERHAFITGIEPDGRVKFAYRGRHQVLFQDVRPADVVWACERAARLTDAQWHQAFDAAAYPREVTERYIAALRRRIDQGLALRERAR